MNIQYLVINRSTDSIGRFTSAYDVAVYMLGGKESLTTRLSNNVMFSW